MPGTPLLDPALYSAFPAQKHVTYNEALRILDAVVQLSVVGRTKPLP
jgi:hypothetical protein